MSSYHPIALLLAALLGAGAVSIAVHAYLEWRMRVAVEGVMQITTEATRNIQTDVARQQRDTKARRQTEMAQLEQQNAAKVAAVRERQVAEEDQHRAMLAEADRKERAWAKYYKKPAICSDAATMECANGFIRAKRMFEEKYARGEL